jgi:hypothetical protein
MTELRIRIQEAPIAYGSNGSGSGPTALLIWMKKLKKLTPCRSVQASAEPGQGLRRSHPTQVNNTEH